MKSLMKSLLNNDNISEQFLALSNLDEKNKIEVANWNATDKDFLLNEYHRIAIAFMKQRVEQNNNEKKGWDGEIKDFLIAIKEFYVLMGDDNLYEYKSFLKDLTVECRNPIKFNDYSIFVFPRIQFINQVKNEVLKANTESLSLEKIVLDVESNFLLNGLVNKNFIFNLDNTINSFFNINNRSGTQVFTKNYYDSGEKLDALNSFFRVPLFKQSHDCVIVLNLTMSDKEKGARKEVFNEVIKRNCFSLDNDEIENIIQKFLMQEDILNNKSKLHKKTLKF